MFTLLGLQVNDGFLECFILLQMLGQCVAMAEDLTLIGVIDRRVRLPLS